MVLRIKYQTFFVFLRVYKTPCGINAHMFTFILTLKLYPIKAQK